MRILIKAATEAAMKAEFSQSVQAVGQRHNSPGSPAEPGYPADTGSLHISRGEVQGNPCCVPLECSLEAV